jgi:hypothetical protein
MKPTFLLFLAAFLLSLIALVITVRADDPAATAIVRVSSANTPAVVRLDALGVTSLGAVTVDMLYDPGIIQPVGCDPLFGTGVCNLQYAGNIVRLVAADSVGVTGDVALADIAFAAVGQGCSPLTVQVVTLADTEGEAIEATVQSGQVCVVNPCVEWDHNHDGRVDLRDVLLHKALFAYWGQVCEP